MNQLDIFLTTTDPLFAFSTLDFATFTETYPDIQLVFHDSEDALLAVLPTIEYLDTWIFKEAWYQRAPKLKHIFTPAAGMEFVERNPNVPVQYGQFHGALMAETTLGLILNFSLRLDGFRSQQQNAIWQRLPLRSITKQTAIILGYGAIGRSCGQLLSRLGMNVIGVKRNPNKTMDGEVRIIAASEMTDYLPSADHVISFLPGGQSTQHFISASELRLMAPSAFLYNLGRGSTIDEVALLDALQNGQLAGAALDVTEIEPLPMESPLWNHPKVLVLPHNSAYFEEYRTAHVTELTDLIGKLYLSLQKN